MLACLNTLNAQSKRIGELREEQIHGLHLYFYPSSIRMLNVSKDEQFYELVKDIKNVRYMNFSNSPAVHERLSLLKNQLEEEGYEELMVMRLQQANVKLMTHTKRANNMVAIVNMDEQWFVLDLRGKINPMLLSQQWQNGFSLGPLDSFLELNQKKEESKKKRAELKEALEKEKSESLRPEDFEDSITN